MTETKRFDDKGYQIVGEEDFCEHWEPGHGTLVPLKECWYCKWSDFRKEGNDDETTSICRYAGNCRKHE